MVNTHIHPKTRLKIVFFHQPSRHPIRLDPWQWTIDQYLKRINIVSIRPQPSEYKHTHTTHDNIPLTHPHSPSTCIYNHSLTPHLLTLILPHILNTHTYSHLVHYSCLPATLNHLYQYHDHSAFIKHSNIPYISHSTSPSRGQHQFKMIVVNLYFIILNHTTIPLIICIISICNMKSHNSQLNTLSGPPSQGHSFQS